MLDKTKEDNHKVMTMYYGEAHEVHKQSHIHFMECIKANEGFKLLYNILKYKNNILTLIHIYTHIFKIIIEIKIK